MASASEIWQRAQRGWPEQYPLAQAPNPPLIVALGGLAVATVADGSVSDYGQATFYAAGAVWAWLELTDGANAVRRTMGAAGLAYVVARVAQAL